MRKTLISGLFLAFGLISSGLCAAAETWTVRHAAGENVVLRAGQTQWLRLQAGEEIYLGDRVVSPEGSFLQLGSPRGTLEISDSTEFFIRSAAGSESGGSVTFELVSGHLKGDWNSDRHSPLRVQVPGGAFEVENGFFSLWIYSLMGRLYTRMDLFRGEGWFHETSGSVPLILTEGQHMTAGLETQQGPREAPVVPGFDSFEIDPWTGLPAAEQPPEEKSLIVPTAMGT